MGKKNSEKSDTRKNKTSFLYTLTCRMLLFVFLTTSTVFILYLTGNFQHFLDSSQRYLLRWCSISCVFMGILSAASMLMSIIMFFVTFHPKYWIYFVLELLALAVSVAGFIIMYVLTFISAGI